MSSNVVELPAAKTLEDRFQEAPLPAPAAIRCALQVAAALRHAHEQGLVSGGIDPRRIVFAAGRMEIQEGCAPQAYIAPEVVAGRPADARSDVFAFGCVLYRLLTGRDAFTGDNAEAAPVQTVLDHSGPVPIGQFPGLERLLRQCLAKDPEQRLQRMQKVYLELKLLRLGGRRPDVSLSARRERADAALRNELDRVERSLGFRIDACDRSLAEVRDAQESLRASVAAVQELTARLETGLEETIRTTGCVEEALSGQIGALEEQLHTQGSSLDALRTAMCQTDDLLERVVEAFDSLQTYVVERSDDKAQPSQA